MKNREQIAVNLAFCFIVLLSLTCPARADATQDATERINHVICTVINLIQMVAGAIAAIVIMFAGVRWMLSSDDPSARNGAKTIIIGAFVGIIIIAIAIPVINLVTIDIINGLNCNIIPGADAMQYANQRGSTGDPVVANENPPKQNLPNMQIGDVMPGENDGTMGLVLKITIKNAGTADADDIRVQAYRSGGGKEDMCDNIAMHLSMYGGPLKPGGESTVTCKITKASLNSLLQNNEHLLVTADSDKKITESDETDNVRRVFLKVQDETGEVSVSWVESDCDGNVNRCMNGLDGTKTCGEAGKCEVGKMCKYSGLPFMKSCTCEPDDTCPSAPPKIEFVLGVDKPYGMDPETNKPFFNFNEEVELEYEPGTDTIQMWGRISIEFEKGWTSCDCSYHIDESEYMNNIEIHSYQPNLFPIEISTSPPSRLVTVKVGCFCDGIWGGATDTVSISPKT